MNGQRVLWTAVLVSALVLPARLGVCATSPFPIQNIQLTGDGGFALTWATPPAKSNQVMYTDSLTNAWQDLAGGLLVADTNVYSLSYTDYPSAGTLQRFYRIKTSQANVVMTLVLDRSTSMRTNGGDTALVPAVTDFLSFFDDTQDHVAMVSFSSAASTDVVMEQPFKDDITNAANALVFGGSTCSERGLTNALAQNNTIASGPNVVKVMVFFTDGIANTFYYPSFLCGPRNVGVGARDMNPFIYDPVTGYNTSCSLPSTIPSIDGVDTVNLSGVDCVSIHLEAQRRAEAIASLARS